MPILSNRIDLDRTVVILSFCREALRFAVDPGLKLTGELVRALIVSLAFVRGGGGNNEDTKSERGERAAEWRGAHKSLLNLERHSATRFVE